MYACMPACLCMSVYVYIYVYAYINNNMYIYIYLDMLIRCILYTSFFASTTIQGLTIFGMFIACLYHFGFVAVEGRLVTLT